MHCYVPYFHIFVAIYNHFWHVLYFPAHKTHFLPQKCDLNSTCVLCAEGKYYFQTYKYPYIFRFGWPCIINVAEERTNRWHKYTCVRTYRWHKYTCVRTNRWHKYTCVRTNRWHKYACVMCWLSEPTNDTSILVSSVCSFFSHPYIPHLYREIVKFASKSWDLASLLVNILLSYPGIYPNVYIASHVIPGIYAAAVAKCSQV